MSAHGRFSKSSRPLTEVDEVNEEGHDILRA